MPQAPVSRRPGEDEGFALVAVLGTMAVLSLFLMTTLNYSLQSLPGARGDQDGKAAVAAAQAGIDDYLSRLNANGNYWTSTDPDNTAFTTGLAIAGTGGMHGSFTYEVLSTVEEVTSKGALRLAVTGKSRGKTRTLTATLKPVGFLKYVYYTDVEAVDPVLYSGRWAATVNGVDRYTGAGQRTYYYVSDPATVNAMCSRYYYAGRPNTSYTSSTTSPILVYVQFKDGPLSYSHSITDGTIATLGSANSAPEQRCKNIQWITGDVVDGPMHSNDALFITGEPLFTHQSTETSWADGATPAPDPNKRWWGSGTPSSSGYRPIYYAPVKLPPSNSKLRTAAVDHGCVYTGATKITFTNDSMTVWSPNTTTAKPECFTPANRANPQTITPIPPALYVEASTATTCAGVGYPLVLADGRTETRLGATPDHNCHLGNAYVSGVLKGKTTVGSDNDIVVVGNTTYASDTASTAKVEGTDVLGLVANNYVWVYHPVDAGGTNMLTGTQEVHNISAAILSVRHSFLVQSWDHGALVNHNGEKLNVTGSISQKFRGPVGTASKPSGYLKNYVYDGRLLTIPPPYFLQPDEAPWQVHRVSG
jgi:Tfp pilus assembly protein PilX